MCKWAPSTLTIVIHSSNSYMKRQQWVSICESILRLADNLRKYASSLEQQNQTVQSNQAKICLSDVDDFDMMLPASSNTKPTILLLDTEAFTMPSLIPRILSHMSQKEVWQQSWFGGTREMCAVLIRAVKIICILYGESLKGWQKGKCWKGTWV